MNHNLPIPSLLDIAIKKGEGIQVKNGAFVVTTGKRTGRSPADRFLVDDALTHDVVDWGENNQPIEAEKFLNLWDESEEYLKGKDKYTADLHVGASSEHYQPVTIEMNSPGKICFVKACLFKRNLLIPNQKMFGNLDLFQASNVILVVMERILMEQ